MTKLKIIIILFFIASNVFAGPSIIGVTGVFSNGETITISGSDFGAHADYHNSVAGKLAWKWQNYESALDYDGFEYNEGDPLGNYWTRLTANGRSGYWSYRTGSGNIQYFQTNHDSISTGVFFVSWWSYLPVGVDGGKTIRIAFSGWGDIDWWINCAEGNVASDTHSFTDYGVYSHPTGEWVRIDILFTGSSAPTSQKIYLIGENSNNPVYSKTYDTIQVRDTVQLMLGAGYGSTEGYWGFDDVYANFTQARVEICNSPVWSSRSQCEIQPVSAWAASEIQTPINRGGFASDATAYLYIVDSAGNVSIGHQITFGDEGEPPATNQTISGGVDLKGASLQ